MPKLTGQKVGVEVTGKGPGFPAFQSVAGSPGYPATAPPLKGALSPYWATGTGVPAYVAPIGSLYTQYDATAPGQPSLWIRVNVQAGNTIRPVWVTAAVASPGFIPSSSIAPGTFIGAFIFTTPPTMSGAGITAGSIPLAALGTPVVTATGFVGPVIPGNGTVAGTAGVYSGNGSPNGSLSAPNGSLFMQFDAVVNPLWVNTTGASATGTVWTAVALP